MGVIEELESEVRSYSRAWPAVFTTARGARLHDADGREYIDFFAGAGALNYGHNDPALIAPVVEYLQSDGILHSLDMTTQAKVGFLEQFRARVLQPRGLDYKVQFPGPTGANAVEAALKLARKVTGRRTVVGFRNAFHGVTLGALAVTASPVRRAGAGVPLRDAVQAPYESDGEGTADPLDALAAILRNPDDPPAAVIVETVQAEGGVNVASDAWLRALAALCTETGVLLIVDDIQVGCGRTGPFFSFEPAGIRPDIVTLSKSISGIGQPLALTLIRPELDIWAPGEHNGTFRGNNLAFVAGTAALRYWHDDTLSRAVDERATVMRAALDALRERYPESFSSARGRGMIQGIVSTDPTLADRIAAAAYERGLLLETCGAAGEVVKLLPPLTIDRQTLDEGLDRLARAAEEQIAATVSASTPGPNA